MGVTGLLPYLQKRVGPTAKGKAAPEAFELVLFSHYTGKTVCLDASILCVAGSSAGAGRRLRALPGAFYTCALCVFVILQMRSVRRAFYQVVARRSDQATEDELEKAALAVSDDTSKRPEWPESVLHLVANQCVRALPLPRVAAPPRAANDTRPFRQVPHVREYPDTE